MRITLGFNEVDCREMAAYIAESFRNKGFLTQPEFIEVLEKMRPPSHNPVTYKKQLS